MKRRRVLDDDSPSAETPVDEAAQELQDLQDDGPSSPTPLTRTTRRRTRARASTPRRLRHKDASGPPTLRARILNHQQQVLQAGPETSSEDDSNATSEKGATPPARTRRRRVVLDDEDAPPHPSASDERSMDDFIVQEEEDDGHAMVLQQRASLHDLDYWFPVWLEYLACCVADPSFAQLVEQDAQRAEYYDQAMRAVEGLTAGRAIEQAYSAAWTSALPGFLRAIQLVGFRGTPPKCQACQRAGHAADIMLQLSGPPGNPAWRHGMSAAARMAQERALLSDSDSEGQHGEHAAGLDPVSGAVLPGGGVSLRWKVGGFCAVRAHAYHDLYHYKRRVCMVLARHLRTAVQTSSTPDDAVTALLQDRELVDGLREGLRILCSVAQGLQLGQGMSSWRGEYGEGQNLVRRAAVRMGAEAEACEDEEDWRMADRALGGGGEEEEEEVGDDDEEHDDDDDDSNHRGALVEVKLEGGAEASAGGCRVTAGTQTCEEMHKHAVVVLRERLGL